LSAAEKGKGRAVSGGGGGLAGRDGRDVLTDWDLHKRVLVKNPQLAKLHYDLVRAGELTDAEFWEGREVSFLSRLVSFAFLATTRSSSFFSFVWCRFVWQLLLLSESASSNQSAGRSSQLIDDRWSVKDSKGKGKEGASTGGGGSATSGTISLTPELIRDIFDEFPEVQEAYHENVPGVSSFHPSLSEEEERRCWS